MCAVLDPPNVQGGRSELHLTPTQVHQFGSAQTMAVGHQDHCAVAGAPAVTLGRGDQPLDLSLGQVFAGAQLAIQWPLWSNCSVYNNWGDQLEVSLGHVFRAQSSPGFGSGCA